MTYHATRKMVFTAEGTTPEIIEEVLAGLRAHHDPQRGKWTPAAYHAMNDVDNLILVVGMTLNLGLLELPREQVLQELEEFTSESGRPEMDRAFQQIIRHILLLPNFP